MREDPTIDEIRVVEGLRVLASVAQPAGSTEAWPSLERGLNILLFALAVIGLVRHRKKDH